MNLAAISHDATARDCFCLEPDRFVFRLRCAKGDIARVVLHHQDKYLPLSIQDTRGEVPMTVAILDTIANTSILQPTLPEMGNWWTPIETLGRNIVAGDVTADNGADSLAKTLDVINNGGL